MCLKRARSEGSSVSRLDEPDAGAAVAPSSHASDPMACAVGRQGTLVESPMVRSAASRAGARVRRGAACVSPRKGANDAPVTPLTGKMPIRRRG
eukprot:scaffold19374_cov69-Phaeocystis_antarctica.AAC.5